MKVVAIEETGIEAGSVVDIRRFNPKHMKKDAAILFIGPRRSGKTVSMRHIVRAMRKNIDAAFAMCPTKPSRDAMSEFIPSSLIHPEFDLAKLEEVTTCMKNWTEEWRSEAARKGTPDDFRRSITLVLLDDCMSDPKLFKDPRIREIFLNGRHFDILFMNLMQYAVDMPPALRANIDYLFLTRTNNAQDVEKYYNMFFKSIYSSFDDFKFIFKRATDNYRVLVLDNTIKPERETDRVFTFKANPNIPPFRVGRPSLWRKHFEHMTDKNEEIRAKKLSRMERLRQAYGDDIIEADSDCRGKKKSDESELGRETLAPYDANTGNKRGLNIGRIRIVAEEEEEAEDAAVVADAAVVDLQPERKLPKRQRPIARQPSPSAFGALFDLSGL